MLLFLNQDYAEEDEEDEFKVFFIFHLIHLLQYNPGSKNVRNARKINSSFTYVRRTCRGEPCVRPSYIGTKALLVRGRT